MSAAVHQPALTDNQATVLYILMDKSTDSVREIEQAVLEALHQAGRLVEPQQEETT
jgi:hypothetical protein